MIFFYINNIIAIDKLFKSRLKSKMHSKVTSLFVGNLHVKVTPNELYETFSAFGGVASVYISRNKRTKLSRGFSYVNFYLEKDGKSKRFICYVSFLFCLLLFVYKSKNLQLVYTVNKKNILHA